MPDDITPLEPGILTPEAAKPARRAATRTPRAKPVGGVASGRKPRGSKKPDVVIATPPGVVMTPGPVVAPEDAVRAAGAVRQAAEELESLLGRRDELLRSIAEAEQRLAELERRGGGVAQLDGLREGLDAAAARASQARDRAADASRQAEAVVERIGELDGPLVAARTDADAARRVAEEASAAVRDVEGRAASVHERLRFAREEFSSLDVPARQLLDELRAAVEEARAARPVQPEFATPAVPVPTPAPEPVDPVSPPVRLPEVVPVPMTEQAAGARDRLIHYLNDARSVEKEQVDLLRQLAEGAADADIRAEFLAHREVSEAQRKAVEARVRSLGGEPSGGRGLLGRIAARFWEALHEPRDGADADAEALLKALGAAEVEAATYLAVHSLARALGDLETAELAANHLRQERAFADRLRSRIAPAAVRAARAPVTAGEAP